MPWDAEQIDHTLVCLAHTVSGALAASGWQTRQLGPTTGVALTRNTGNGIMATAQRRAWLRRPRWRHRLGRRPGGMSTGPIARRC